MVDAVATAVRSFEPAQQAPRPPEKDPPREQARALEVHEEPSRQRDEPEFDDKALDKIAERLVSPESRLAIQQDDEIRRFIYKFFDKSNGDLLRQYPHERVLEAMHGIAEARQRFSEEVASRSLDEEA